MAPPLRLVGTPVGNLEDLSERAATALREADVIAAEDTRRARRLLSHLGIPTPRLVRFDEHTERDVAPALLEAVESGAAVVVISDAGMPGLSDPGGHLVALAAEAGVTVEVVPGPFAAVIGLVASGLLDQSGRFCFEGFLPRKGAARAARIRELVGERRTIVLYEAPHRLVRTLADLEEALGGEREVALARELTKRHEEVWRGRLSGAVLHFERNEPRGEFVIVLRGASPEPEVGDDVLRDALDSELERGATRRDAAALVAERHGVPPNRVKRLLMSDAKDRTTGEPSDRR